MQRKVPIGMQLNLQGRPRNTIRKRVGRGILMNLPDSLPIGGISSLLAIPTPVAPRARRGFKCGRRLRRTTARSRRSLRRIVLVVNHRFNVSFHNDLGTVYLPPCCWAVCFLYLAPWAQLMRVTESPFGPLCIALRLVCTEECQREAKPLVLLCEQFLR